MKALLITGDPRMPTQPTRIPVRILKDFTSQLNSLGVDLLNREFVYGAMCLCRESIAAVYNDLVSDASSDATLQMLADVSFLEIALRAQEKREFNGLREELVHKVSFHFIPYAKYSVMRESWRN